MQSPNETTGSTYGECLDTTITAKKVAIFGTGNKGWFLNANKPNWLDGYDGVSAGNNLQPTKIL